MISPSTVEKKIQCDINIFLSVKKKEIPISFISFKFYVNLPYTPVYIFGTIPLTNCKSCESCVGESI